MTTATSQSTDALSGPEFDKIRTMLDREAAIQVNDGQEYLIENRLRPLMKRFELATFSDLARNIDRDRTLKAAVVDAMTTNETLFFRDTHPFDAIADLLKEAESKATASEPFTIWCAACSSGQEPYSLAMLIADRFPRLAESGSVKIFASDLSSTMIERCREGAYSQFEVNRGLPAPYLVKYFERAGRYWNVKPIIRSLIQFEEHNLMGSWTSIPRSDIVLMRNVLIYFTPEVKTKLIGQVRRNVLRPGGALFLGSSETIINIDDTLVRQQNGRCVYYQNPES